MAWRHSGRNGAFRRCDRVRNTGRTDCEPLSLSSCDRDGSESTASTASTKSRAGVTNSTAPRSRHNGSERGPSLVTTGTPSARPAMTVVRRLLTPSGYGWMRTSQARRCAAMSGGSSSPVAMTRPCNRESDSSSRTNASLPRPTNSAVRLGSAQQDLTHGDAQERRDQRTASAEMSDDLRPWWQVPQPRLGAFAGCLPRRRSARSRESEARSPLHASTAPCLAALDPTSGSK